MLLEESRTNETSAGREPHTYSTKQKHTMSLPGAEGFLLLSGCIDGNKRFKTTLSGQYIFNCLMCFLKGYPSFPVDPDRM